MPQPNELDLTKVDLGQCSRSAIVERASYDKETRSVPVIVATEGAAMVWDRTTWDMVREILPMSGMRVHESKQVPMLNSHMRYSTEDIRGSIRDIHIEGDKLVGRAVFSSLAEKDATLVNEGHLTDVSAGYRVFNDRTVRLAKGERTDVNGRSFTNDFDDGLDLLIRTEWELVEGSLVPIGADEASKFRSAHIQQPQGGHMATPDQGAIGSQTEAARAAEVAEARKEGALLEAKRRSSLESILSLSNVSDETRAQLRVELIDGGRSVEEAPAIIVEAIRKAAEKASIPATPSVTIGREQAEKEHTGVVNAFLSRCGFSGKAKDAETRKAIDEAGSRSGLPGSIHELARFLDAKSGSRSALLNAEDCSRKSCELWNRSAPGLSTGDFANILVDVSNKMIGMSFDDEITSFQAWTESASARDFKTVYSITKSHITDWAKIKEGEAPVIGKFSDNKESGSMDTYGLAVSVSRQMLINDDLGMFADIMSGIGAGGARAVNDLCCTTLFGTALAGPTMADGTTMFSTAATRVNRKDTSGTVAYTSLNVANKMLMDIKKPQPDKTSVQRIMGRPAKILLAGTDNMADIERYLGAPYDLSQSVANQAPNVWKGRLRTAYDPYLQALLTAGSVANAWYLFSEPVFKVLYLNGQQRPTMRRAESVAGEAHGITMDAFFDFGIQLKDWRIAQVNNGA
jgi:hypothetical protein